MTDSMLERIARAISEHDYRSRVKSDELWNEDTEFSQWYMARARAAVEALRDCGMTDKMLLAWERGETNQQDWRAAIDAILAEKPQDS